MTDRTDRAKNLVLKGPPLYKLRLRTGSRINVWKNIPWTCATFHLTCQVNVTHLSLASFSVFQPLASYLNTSTKRAEVVWTYFSFFFFSKHNLFWRELVASVGYFWALVMTWWMRKSFTGLKICDTYIALQLGCIPACLAVEFISVWTQLKTQSRGGVLLHTYCTEMLQESAVNRVPLIFADVWNVGETREWRCSTSSVQVKYNPVPPYYSIDAVLNTQPA